VAQTLLALYGAQTRPGRRRALVVEAVQRADDVDAGDVLDALVQRDIRDVKPGTHERGEVEDIFERVILARAYERINGKRFAEARQDFEDVAAQTGSLEALSGAIDMGFRLKETPAAIEARFTRPGVPPQNLSFARAYLLARQLPKLEGEAHAKAATAGLNELKASWPALKEERMAQALFGALLHEEYLQTGDLGTAEKANVHYLVALELMGDNPRFRAMIVGELGLLHTDVGNYRIALGYLLERDQLPYTDNTEGLDVLVSKAQALLHAGRDREAAAAGEAALAMIGRNPALAPYRLLALDGSALDNLAAGNFARALALYDEEMPLLDAAQGRYAARNRMVARISRAAAEVGAHQGQRALADLDVVDQNLRDPALLALLQWPHATPARVARTYRLIAAGLRANADRELGRLDAEARAVETRQAILAERLAETHRPEMARQEMLSDARLASIAGQQHDARGAAAWLARALARADELRTRANGVSDKEELDVLRLAAQLTLSLHQPLVPDLSKRVADTADELAARREPALRSYTSWFEIYGVLVAPGAGPPPAESPSAPPRAPDQVARRR
jgi:hypothetical protein